MTLKNDIEALRETYILEECYLLGFHCKPGQLHLICDLLRGGEDEGNTKAGTVVNGEIVILGVETIRFELVGQVAASGDEEIDFGTVDFQCSELGLSIETAVGSILVKGPHLKLRQELSG